MYSKTVLVLAFALFSIVGADDCSKKFKQDETHAKASETCTKNLKITEKDLPKDEAEFTKSYDDKCFGKCFMTEMKFLTDLKFDRDAIKKDIVDHVVDADVQKKMIDYTMVCLDAAEKTKMTKDNECKVAAQFMYCTLVEENKLELNCDPPKETDPPKGA